MKEQTEEVVEITIEEWIKCAEAFLRQCKEFDEQDEIAQKVFGVG